jgi:hypothetical protein
MIDIDQGLGPAWHGPPLRVLDDGREPPDGSGMAYGRCELQPALYRDPPRARAKDIRFVDAEGTIAPAMTGHAAMQLGAAAILVPVTLSASGALAQSSLPDASRTPGAINPAVTQKTIAQTICVRGWTHIVRPPVGYTEELKRQLFMTT